MLIQLLISTAIGLIVMLGAVSGYSLTVGASATQQNEGQLLSHGLHIASVVTREAQTAGFGTAPNTVTATATQVLFSRQAGAGIDNAGFRFNAGSLEMLSGTTWTALTPQGAGIGTAGTFAFSPTTKLLTVALTLTAGNTSAPFNFSVYLPNA